MSMESIGKNNICKTDAVTI